VEKSVYTAEQKHLQDLPRKARIEAGLTRVPLTEKLNTLQATVSDCETGERRLDLIEFCQVLDAIEVSLQEFVDRFEKATGRRQ